METAPKLLPKPGEQYVFEVDLKTCTGCKGCVTACHNLNGLKPEESWRSTGVIESAGGLLTQTITTSCHHCLDPACLEGCPTVAYVKDKVTGVVKHLDDQCIGCQYCILRCPYEAPKWVPSLGIVRKCDLCTERLDVGEETACQQGCPNGAISVVLKSKEKIRAQGPWEIPIDVPWGYTSPTTQYKGGLPPSPCHELERNVQPAEGHLPLVIMLTLTQFSVGLWALAFFLDQMSILHQVSLVAGGMGLLASLFHLGHPEKAYKAFLGFRTSWLSREVLFFGSYAPLAGMCVGLEYAVEIGMVSAPVTSILQGAKIVALLFGLLGVFASAKLYQSTPRNYWKQAKALLGFPLTALILGSAFAYGFATPIEQGWLLAVLISTSQVWLILEVKLNQRPLGFTRQISSLLQGPMKDYWNLERYGLLVFGLLFPVILLVEPGALALSAMMFYGILAACLFERHLFFKLGIGPRMPKGEAS